MAVLFVVVAAASTGCLKTVPIVGLPDIRVENRSAMDFKNVMVNGKSFGNVKRGERTDYQIAGMPIQFAPGEPLIFPIWWF